MTLDIPECCIHTKTHARTNISIQKQHQQHQFASGFVTHTLQTRGLVFTDLNKIDIMSSTKMGMKSEIYVANVDKQCIR